MMPKTPEDWLPILTAKLDNRAGAIERDRSYCNGDAPMPRMGKNVAISWESFQKKARVNYGGLAVRALKNRIRPQGVRVGQDQELNDLARRIWRDNRLTTQFNIAINDRLETGYGYLVTGQLADGRSIITAEHPETFIAITDPLRPWITIAALKVWRDSVAKKDYAAVWADGVRQVFTRKAIDEDGNLRRRAQDNWMIDGEPQTFDGHPPVVSLERPGGVSLLRPHHDVIDSINLGKLQRLVVTAMQAFKQRGIKGDLPDKDPDGNAIDWAKVFEPAPGALWDLPAGIDVWESEQTDIRPLLEGEKADRRDFAAVTTTPLSVFIPDGANQSAEGAANTKENHVSLAEDEIADIAPALAMAMVYALRIESADIEDQTVEIDFAPPALVSLSEKFAAASAARAAGVPWRTCMLTIAGYTAEQVDEMEAERIAEQLDALVATNGSVE